MFEPLFLLALSAAVLFAALYNCPQRETRNPRQHRCRRQQQQQQQRRIARDTYVAAKDRNSNNNNKTNSNNSSTTTPTNPPPPFHSTTARNTTIDITPAAHDVAFTTMSGELSGRHSGGYGRRVRFSPETRFWGRNGRGWGGVLRDGDCGGEEEEEQKERGGGNW